MGHVATLFPGDSIARPFPELPIGGASGCLWGVLRVHYPCNMHGISLKTFWFKVLEAQVGALGAGLGTPKVQVPPGPGLCERNALWVFCHWSTFHVLRILICSVNLDTTQPLYPGGVRGVCHCDNLSMSSTCPLPVNCEVEFEHPMCKGLHGEDFVSFMCFEMGRHTCDVCVCV